MVIKYRVKGYKSVFITTKFNSFGELFESFSFNRGVFKVFDHKPAALEDFVFMKRLPEDEA